MNDSSDKNSSDLAARRRSSGSGVKRRLERSAFLSLLAAAFLLHLWANLRFAVNMPYWDDYDEVLDFLVRLSWVHDLGHQLRLFFSLHNEHRLVFGRLVTAGLSRLFGGVNFLYLNAVGQLGLYLIVLFLLLYARRRLGKSAYLAAPAGILLLAFSQSALMANFAMASLQQYYQLLFALIALYFSTLRKRSLFLPLGLLFATLSTFAGGGGLICFVVILLYLCWERAWLAALGEGAYASAVFALYFFILPYRATAISRASNAFALTHPFEVLRYGLGFVGALGGDHFVISGILVTVVAVLVLVFGMRFRRRDLAFLILTEIFIAATAGGAAWSRLSMGVHEASSSRYAIYSLLFVANLFLGLLLGARSQAGRRLVGVVGLVVALVAFGAWFAPGTGRLVQRQQALKSYLVYPDQSSAANIMKASMQFGLFAPLGSVYRNLPVALPLGRECLYAKGYEGKVGRLVLRGRKLTVEGWAVVPPGRQRAAAVIVDVNGKYFPTVYGFERPLGRPRPVRYSAKLTLVPLPDSIAVSVIVVGRHPTRLYRSPTRVLTPPAREPAAR